MYPLKVRQFNRLVISYRNNDGKSLEVGLGSRTTISFIPVCLVEGFCVNALTYIPYSFLILLVI